MGWFGGLVSKVSSGVKKVGSGIKKAATTIADGAKKTCTKVKEVVTNTWGKFSGKKTFEEADRLYNEISNRYNQKRSDFDKEVNQITNQIESHVNAINSHKSKIKSELFVEMATNLAKIKDIQFSKDFSLEAYKNEAFQFDSVRGKSDLYKIDFNKNKFKTNVQAVFTLGFYTRKKAKETLYAVQEEEKKLDAEIAKMNAELVKLRAVEKSLLNVEYYFASLVEIYEQLLVRLDNSVHYLYFRSMHFAHRLLKQQLSVKRLPLIQQKEVEAIMTASKILKVMTETQIVSLHEKGKIESYASEMESKHNEVVKIYEAA